MSKENIMSNFLALDCESTGVHKECNILSAAFVVFDRGGMVHDKLHVKILPPDGIFSVSPQALEINNINLSHHLLEADPLDKVQNMIRQFLHKNTHSVSPAWDGVGNIKDFIVKNRLIPVGSQVQGDITWIKDKVFPDLSTYVSHKVQDTVTIAEFLRQGCRLNVEKVGLEALAKHFQIDYNPHDALEDSLANAKVYLKLLDLICLNL